MQLLNEGSEETTFGHKMLNMAYRFLLIEANLKQINKPHTFFQVLKSFLQLIASKNPNRFHFDIAEMTLKHFGQDVSKNKHVADTLARELVKACHTLNENISWPDDFAKQVKYQQSAPKKLCEVTYLTVTEVHEADETQFFTKDGLSLWDSALIQLLASFGVTGKAQAIAHAKKMQESSNHWNPLFWLMPHAEKPFFHTEAFFCLATVLWKDIVEEKINVTQKNIVPSTNSKTGIIEIKQQLHLMNGFELISTMHIPIDLKETLCLIKTM